MGKILIVKTGSLSDVSKIRLPKNIILIEVDNLDDVKLLEASQVAGDIMIRSAMKALAKAHSDTPSKYFVEELNKHLNPIQK